MKLRISLSEKNGEIRGKVECEGDNWFMMESLALIVETLSERSGVPSKEVLEDLKRMVQ